MGFIRIYLAMSVKNSNFAPERVSHGLMRVGIQAFLQP